MKHDEIDPRVLEYLRKTNQYELLNKVGSGDASHIVSAAIAVIEKHNGNVQKAIEWVNSFSFRLPPK